MIKVDSKERGTSEMKANDEKEKVEGSKRRKGKQSDKEMKNEKTGKE